MFFVQTREKLTHGLLNSFEKYAKIMHFKPFSKEIFWKLSKISQQFVLFEQTREKLTHGLLKFLEKHAKIIDFSRFS